MKLEKLHVTGFGALKELEFPELAPGLNIIEGANEAGKTTLLEFVRALFFGFADRNKATDNAQRYEPRNGGAHGGWAIVNNSHGERWRIERSGGKSSDGACKVQLLGETNNGEIDVLLDGADKILYKQVFAFGLDEFRDLSDSAGQMEKRVYAASSGNLGEQLINAIDQTDKNAGNIYRKKGRTNAINGVIAQYNELKKSLKQLEDQIEIYNNDRAKWQECQLAAAQLRERYKAAEAELRHTQRNAKAWPTWVELVNARQDLQELPAQSEITEARVRRMEELRADRNKHREQNEAYEPRLERIKIEVESCIVQDEVLENAPDINYLRERLAVYEQSLQALPGLQQQLKNSNQQIAAQLAQLGAEWDEARLSQIDTSREPRLEIEKTEKVFINLQRVCDEAAQVKAGLSRQIEEREKALQRLLEERKSEFPNVPLTKELINQQSHALQDADDLSRKMAEAQTLRDSKKADWETRQQHIAENLKDDPAPKVLLAGMWALLPLILGILSFAFFRENQLLSIVLCVLFLMAAAAIATMAYYQKTRSKDVLLQRQQGRLQEQREIKQLQAAIDSWDEKVYEAQQNIQQITAQFGWDLESRNDFRKVADQLQQQRDARSSYDNLGRDIQRREAEIEQLTQLQGIRQQELTQAKSTFAEQQDNWDQWLREKKLPLSSSPQHTLQLLDLIQKLRADLEKRDESQQQVSDAEAAHRQFAQRIHDLWERLERPSPPQGDIPAAVRAVYDALNTEKNQDVHRKELLAKQQEMQDDKETVYKRLAKAEQQIDALLNATQASDESDFDVKVLLAGRHQAKQSECHQYEKTLETHSAPGPERLALEKTLSELNAEEVEEQLQQSEASFEQCKEAMLEGERQQGEWHSKVQQLEASEGQLTALLRQMEAQKAQAADLVRRWAVAQTTHLLLEQTRSRFEKERQPAVIKRAGELMQRVTNGRYQTVLSTGNLSSVELDEGDSGRKPLWYWSRGTKEQFYLALRLAFIEDYCNAGRREPLPVIMDDVLVHADGYNRLEAASAMITEFAKNHQVLYFTCRPGDAEVLSAASPISRRFRLEEGKVLLSN